MAERCLSIMVPRSSATSSYPPPWPLRCRRVCLEWWYMLCIRLPIETQSCLFSLRLCLWPEAGRLKQLCHCLLWGGSSAGRGSACCNVLCCYPKVSSDLLLVCCHTHTHSTFCHCYSTCVHLSLVETMALPSLHLLRRTMLEMVLYLVHWAMVWRATGWMAMMYLLSSLLPNWPGRRS